MRVLKWATSRVNLALLLFLILVPTLFPSILLYAESRIHFPESKYPELYRELSNETVSASSYQPPKNTDVVCYGIALSYPASNLTVFMQAECLICYKAEGGNGFVVSDQRGPSLLKIFQETQKGTELLKQLFPNIKSPTDFDLRKLEYTYSLRQLKPTTPYRKGKMILAMTLSRQLYGYASEAFSNGQVEGFLRVDPVTQQILQVELFDHFGNHIAVLSNLTREEAEYIAVNAKTAK